jgi:hypothetical protein
MSTTEELTAIRKTIRVEAVAETAFDTFTKKLAAWWPLATHSIHRDRVAEMVFDEHPGGRLYERTATGEEADWADVLEFDRPRRLLLRWRVNPERPPTELEVRFEPEDGATRVELEHRGWAEAADPQGRANYDTGWDYVLGSYVEALSAVPSTSE